MHLFCIFGKYSLVVLCFRLSMFVGIYSIYTYNQFCSKYSRRDIDIHTNTKLVINKYTGTYTHARIYMYRYKNMFRVS